MAEADFGKAPFPPKPKISLGAWVTYLLNRYATVAEVVEDFEKDPLYIVSGAAGHPTIHLSVTDASGDSAIIESLGGKPVIHHDRDYQAKTNSPVFERQLTLNRYWERMDGAKVLPGSHQSEDRFVRASYYLKRLGDAETDPRKQGSAGEGKGWDVDGDNDHSGGSLLRFFRFRLSCRASWSSIAA